MPRFRFRLERVLSVRQHQEDHERIEFGRLMRVKLECDVQLADVKEKLLRAVEQATKVIRSRPTVEDLVRAHEYHVALLRRESDAERAVEDATIALEQQRVRLVEARRRRRALEQLREHRWKEWRAAEETREQDELDEIGLITFTRQASAAAKRDSDHGATGVSPAVFKIDQRALRADRGNVSSTRELLS